MVNKFISVIIPTYNDWDRLALCLGALAKQTYPAESFEIIVVNNNPKDNIPDGFTYQANCTIVTEAKPGSYAARNAGFALSKGEILAFTDSDCIPDANWLKNAVTYFDANPECTRIGGDVKLFYKDKKLTRAELYEKVYAFRQAWVVKLEGASVTANMIAYRSVFDKIGVFNDQMMSGGDYEWGKRASAAGSRIDYVANVIVNHPARYLMSELISKAKRVTGGEVGLEKAGRVSKIAAFKNFIRPFLRPHKDLKAIYLMAEGLTFAERTKVLIVRYQLIGLRAAEKLKVYRGKTPGRH